MITHLSIAYSYAHEAEYVDRGLPSRFDLNCCVAETSRSHLMRSYRKRKRFL